MKRKFKYDLGQHVLIVGRKGVSVVEGRGEMKFSSGGKRNMYQIVGAHSCFVNEEVLLSLEESKKFIANIDDFID